MKKEVSIYKLKGDLSDLDRVSLTLQRLVGLSLDDILRQSCACTPEEAAAIEYKNMLKIQEFFNIKRVGIQ